MSQVSIAIGGMCKLSRSATANRTAKFLGVKYHKKHMDEQALVDNFEDATWLDEQPNPDLNFIGMYALSKLVRDQGFRVILNGTGNGQFVDRANEPQDKGQMRYLEAIHSFCPISSGNKIQHSKHWPRSHEELSLKRS